MKVARLAGEKMEILITGEMWFFTSFLREKKNKS
jgi:hypothetical protein